MASSEALAPVWPNAPLISRAKAKPASVLPVQTRTLRRGDQAFFEIAAPRGARPGSVDGDDRLEILWRQRLDLKFDRLLHHLGLGICLLRVWQG